MTKRTKKTPKKAPRIEKERLKDLETSGTAGEDVRGGSQGSPASQAPRGGRQDVACAPGGGGFYSGGA